MLAALVAACDQTPQEPSELRGLTVEGPTTIRLSTRTRARSLVIGPRSAQIDTGKWRAMPGELMNRTYPVSLVERETGLQATPSSSFGGPSSCESDTHQFALTR